LIVKNLEKIADFAVSIAEEALFNIEGVFYKHSKLKYAYKNEELPTSEPQTP
jgi:phosphate uptake regulator